MMGKIIRVSDYKFAYGEETIYINVFGVIKDNKSGNKYIIYSYDNKKLYYGSFFIRDNSGTIMISKDTKVDIINTFIEDILSENRSAEYEIINIDNIDSVQVIDESVYDTSIDIEKLCELTIPKKAVEEEIVPKKKTPLFVYGIMLLLILVGAFLFINPEVINGKNALYSCVKTYNHKVLPANIKEERTIIFNGKGKVIGTDISTDYIFTDVNYYSEFKNKSYFYKYMNEADTYKFDDINYTYRVFSKIDVNDDYFLPDTKDELINYYKNNEYNCKIKEE